MDSTRPTSLYMNKLTTTYWNSYMIWKLFCNSKYRNALPIDNI